MVHQLKPLLQCCWFMVRLCIYRVTELALTYLAGTSTTGQETWGEGYVPALSANGYTACYVTLRKSVLPPT